jgi:hypothetical protein
MKVRAWLLALGAALAFTTGAVPQARPPAQKTGPITIFGDGSSGPAGGFSVPALMPDALPPTLSQVSKLTLNLGLDAKWGTSQADNDRVFASALAYSQNTATGNVTIDIPMGTWRLTVPRTVTTTKPFKIRGAGRGQTRVIVDTGASSLLTLTQQTVGAQVSVEGIEFRAASPGVATPLSISFTGTANGPSPYYQYSSLYFHDLSFVGNGNTDTTGVNYFTNGFDVTNAWQPVVDQVHFTGAVQNRRAAQNGGVFRYSFAAQITNFFAHYAVRGLYLPGGATNGQNDEGFAWRSGEVVDVDYGIEAIGIDADPGFIIGPVHMNAGKSCVRTVFKSQFDMSRVLCYKLTGDANDFNGFDIQKAAYGYLSNIQISDSRGSNNGGAFTGIKITDSFGITLNGVQAQGWQNNSGFLLYLEGTTDGTRAFNIDAAAVNGLNAVGFGANVGFVNRFNNVYPAVLQGFAVNNPTPVVGNDRSGLWTTTNTSPTSITALPYIQSGQELTIFAQDAQTTYVHSPSMRLKGGVNATVPAGATITFRQMGGNLVETGRSF